MDSPPHPLDCSSGRVTPTVEEASPALENSSLLVAKCLAMFRPGAKASGQENGLSGNYYRCGQAFASRLRLRKCAPLSNNTSNLLKTCPGSGFRVTES